MQVAVAVLVVEKIRILIHLQCWMMKKMPEMVEIKIMEQVNQVVVVGVDLVILKKVTIVIHPNEVDDPLRIWQNE